ncbi:MAG: hypothetical protein ACRDJW_25325 [Thermomicrobiales bacterium]
MTVQRLSRSSRVVSVCIVVLLSLVLPVLSAGSATANREPITLYVGRFFASFTPIDPMTLQDDMSRPTVELDSIDDEDFVLISADGSTRVVVGYDGEVTVHDGIDGAVRSHFSVDGAGSLEASNVPEALSADGTRLLVGGDVFVPDRDLYKPVWKVFDTRTGELIATVQRGADVFGPVVVDAGATRLYRLVGVGRPEHAAENTSPFPARLIAYDLTTGEELDRLDLPGIHIGTWTTGEGLKQVLPALALSPDGESVAIVHADSDAMTVSAAADLTVERTVALSMPQSWRSRLLGLLLLAPQSASAKVAEGAFKAAVFSPDGNRLYVSGTEWTAEDDPDDVPSLGLRVIDVTSGEVLGEALDDVYIDRVISSPDGQSLYVTAADVYGPSDNFSWVLLRLDAQTFDVLAERTFSSYPWLLIVPEGTSA